MAHMISLLPLDAEYHAGALQAVYTATLGYWQMYGLEGPPPDQAHHDLAAANETPGRYLVGIVKRVDEQDTAAGAELIGLVDFRVDWPAAETVTIGMLMVAAPYQRQGIGTQTWALLSPWLAASAHMQKARLSIEQFNIGALKFWESLGFSLTGDSDRVRSGDQFIRLLYLESALPSP